MFSSQNKTKMQRASVILSAYLEHDPNNFNLKSSHPTNQNLPLKLHILLRQTYRKSHNTNQQQQRRQPQPNRRPSTFSRENWPLPSRNASPYTLAGKASTPSHRIGARSRGDFADGRRRKGRGGWCSEDLFVTYRV